MACMRVRLSWHLAWIKIQLRCVLPLGEALWALIVGCSWETTEEALTALVRSSQCFLEDTFGTRQGSRAVLQVVDEVCQNPVGKILYRVGCPEYQACSLSRSVTSLGP